MLCDEQTEHFDCDGCLWPGVTVVSGNVDFARSQFEAHDCENYINFNSFKK